MSNINNFISSQVIIAQWYQRTRQHDETFGSDAIDWIAEALGLIDAPGMYFWVIEELPVKSRQIKLPCGCKRIEAVSYKNEPLHKLSGNFLGDARRGYIQNGPYLVFNFDADKVKIKYLTLPLDDEGYPLVPDDESFHKALFYYLELQYRYADWMQGTLPQYRYEYIEREWNWYCGQAAVKAMNINIDSIEAAKDTWVKLRQYPNHYKTMFNSMTMPERFDRS